jgi:hypothetical protein
MTNRFQIGGGRLHSIVLLGHRSSVDTCKELLDTPKFIV